MNMESHLPLKPLDLGILLVLADADEYGYAIVKQLARREYGAITLAPSNLYTVLDRMIDADLVEGRGRKEQGGRPARRYFGITALGRRVLAAEAARLRAVVRHVDTVGGISGG
jgi:PadR family transcriptional regulator PadR